MAFNGKLLTIGLLILFSVFFVPAAHAASSEKVIIFRDDDAQGFWVVEPLKNITTTLIQNNIPQTIGLIPFIPSSGSVAYVSEVAPAAGTVAAKNLQKALATRTARIKSAAASKSTLGITGTISSAPAGYASFGDDAALKSYLLSIKGTSAEIAVHGFIHSENEFQSINYSSAKTKITQGVQDIYSELGVTPITFIVPYNEFNNNTLNACKDSGIIRFSAASYTDTDAWKEKPAGLLHVPDTAEFYDWDTDSFRTALAITADCQASLDQYNVCVILMHPQEFTNDDYETMNQSRYKTLLSVIAWAKQKNSQEGVKLMNIGQYGSNVSPTKLPNGQACLASANCTSNNCNNGYCCNVGQCGWLNGTAGTCIANGTNITNQTLNGICRSGTWKTVYGGIGCNIFQCDSGTCANNYCKDAASPLYSNIRQSPSGNPTYGQAVQCNATWTDNAGISRVLFQSNYTGIWQNYTPLVSGLMYYYTIPSAQLTGGEGVGWLFWANDTSNNINGTMPTQVFTVQKANTTMVLYINGTGSDKSFKQNQTANLTASLSVSGMPVQIWTNLTGSMSLLALGVSPLQNLAKLTYGPGNYTLKANFSGNENYTASESAHMITISSSPANSTNTTKTVQLKTLNGNSDAYESSNGKMYPSDNVVVVGKSASTYYRGGYLFTNTSIPKGASIISATLKLPYNWRSGANANTLIYGEASDSPGQFTATASNITKRQKTVSSVVWNKIPTATWGKYVISPDISSIVREVVGRPNWSSGNSLAILQYEATNATSTWEAVSYEGCKGSTCAPVLEIQYIG